MNKDFNYLDAEYSLYNYLAICNIMRLIQVKN